MSNRRLGLCALIVLAVGSATSPAQPVLGPSGANPKSMARSWEASNAGPGGESANTPAPVRHPGSGVRDGSSPANHAADGGSAIIPIAVPEPGALLLTGAAVAWAVGSIRRKRREPGA